jgi:hypothetical protein
VNRSSGNEPIAPLATIPSLQILSGSFVRFLPFGMFNRQGMGFGCLTGNGHLDALPLLKIIYYNFSIPIFRKNGT